MIADFLKGHGSGWWLHMLGAAAIMAVGWWFESLMVGRMPDWFLVAVIINTLLWPIREWWQKVSPNQGHLRFGEGTEAIFTLHVLLEWVPAVAVGFIIYVVA
jgi:hypothetical protein